MGGAFLVGLDRHLNAASGDRRLDLLAALSKNDDASLGAQGIDPVEQMKQQRPPGDRVQYLVRVGAHARSLPGGKDDHGKAALVAHRAEQWHGAFAGARVLRP